MPHEPETCVQAGRTLQLLADALSPAEAAAAAAHLAHCDRCRQLALDARAVDTLYAALPAQSLEVGALNEVLESLPAFRRQPGRGFRPLAAAAALAAAFVGGAVVGGTVVGMWERSSSVPVQTALTPVDPGPGQAGALERAMSVARLPAGPDIGAELVRRLAVEPNANVRLAMLDALRGRPLARPDQARLMNLLTTEPVPALRIELLEIVTTHRPAGLRSVLARLARQDDAVAVRRLATRTLAME